MSKICRNCNSVLMDTASFCNNCGARVADAVFDSEKMKKCEHCGAALYKSARFCTNCGLPVGVPEAVGYAGRCERCGTWLKINAQFCTNCGRRVSMQTYNFTQQPAAPVQDAVVAGTVVPVSALPPTDDVINTSVVEEKTQPKVLPSLNSRPTRKNDYEDDMKIDMNFDLPPVDEIVVSAPLEKGSESVLTEEVVDVVIPEETINTENDKSFSDTNSNFVVDQGKEDYVEVDSDVLSGEII